MNKKKVLISVMVLSVLLFLWPSSIKASNETVGGKLAALEKNLSLQEAKAIVEDYARSENISSEKAERVLTNELSAKIKQEEKVFGKEKKGIDVRGGSSGRYTLLKAKSEGDVFFTPAQTLKIFHGHVGIYYKKDLIVESTPGYGVHTLAYNGRKVEKNALMQEVKQPESVRTAAANWAFSRSGKDHYSYNFVANRKTGHYGPKNCSKLVWSAYKLAGNIDIDCDEGLGVYPIDVINSYYTQTYKRIE